MLRLQVLPPTPLKVAAVALGSFDGVHIGHRAIIQHAVDTAAMVGGLSAVFTLFPHPGMVTGRAGLRTITTQEQRAALIAACGVDILIEYPFTRDFASLAPIQFLQGVLLKGLEANHIVTGFNYTFGHLGAGDAALLQSLSKQHRFTMHEIAPVKAGGETVSSTRVRNLIEDGRFQEVHECLGRHFALQGQVVTGDGRGRLLGFPTANLRLESHQVLPPLGVYLVGSKIHGFGVANLGKRPTYPQEHVGLEVHLMEARQGIDLYGDHMEVELLAFLRPEKVFSDEASLRMQIASDVEVARALAYSRFKC